MKQTSTIRGKGMMIKEEPILPRMLLQIEQAQHVIILAEDRVTVVTEGTYGKLLEIWTGMGKDRFSLTNRLHQLMRSKQVYIIPRENKFKKR